MVHPREARHLGRMRVTMLSAFLFLSGSLGAAIGAALLLVPVSFEASAGINLPVDPSLLSELRAPGGALLALGALTVAGAFLPRLAPTSLLVATLVYLSYGVSRAVGLLFDGPPSGSIVLAMIAELAVGIIGLWLLGRGGRSVLKAV